MFFGKYPPRGFQERPAARYLLPSDSIVNAPAPQGLRAGETPFAGTPAARPPTPASTSMRPRSTRSSARPRSATGPPEAACVRRARRPLRASRPDDSSAGTRPAFIARPRSRAPAPACRPPPCRARRPRSSSPRTRCRTTVARAPRVDLFVNFTIQLVDEWGAVLQEELTVADNVAKGGARVMTSLAFQVGDVLLLQEAGGGFATRAEVRGITRAQRTVDRLHLRFLDRQAPERLLTAVGGPGSFTRPRRLPSE